MNRKARGHTEKLVAKLVAEGGLELVEGGDVEAVTEEVIEEVGNALVAWTEDGDLADERGESLGELLSRLRPVAEVYATDEELQAAIDRWRKGVRGPDALVTNARDAAIEAKLVAGEDDDLAAVYADWLIEHGNPLGEVLACAMDEKLRKKALAKYAGAVWGPVLDYVKLFEIAWGRAGAVGIAVERQTKFELEWGRVIGALLDRPVAAFCRSLSIGPLPPEASTQLEDMLDIVAAGRPRASLWHVALRGGSWNVRVGDLAVGYPNLVALDLDAGYVPVPLAHPRLETLTLRLNGLGALEHAMAAVELPRLRMLRLATRYATSAHPLGKLVDMPWFGQLEELDVSGLGFNAREIVLGAYRDRVAHLRIT